ncbi:type IV secretion system protein TrbL [Sphingobium sp. YR657]|uniref:P-type conjugative transfer protein TrbL n=1 Tax=Sphingobium sp. YR657 TaxID=1884366 RepID=UPI000916EE38|nr:P-type conjugative transfer protein TrbL [Sphingobium sp. YR657]SHL52573.1 type IV secretion system protein TrbL [Sphingobium sp. YR657]
MAAGTLDLNIVDKFLDTFSTYIDSGFGLLSGDVAFLTTALIGIDVTLAALWWALDADQDILGKLVKKVLYVGSFAFILSNFNSLADIIFRSFSGLGITAGGGGFSADDLKHPGEVAATGFEAAYPLLEAVTDMLGFPKFFGHFLDIAVLLIAWLIVVVAFFILAIQLFITIVEFKLTSLAGFVLVPFALWNKSSFLAERVLGNVISSGIKVMVLAVILGIGSNLFADMRAVVGGDPGIEEALTLLLGALTLFGLGIFGPGIASGLVSGAPQLGAGAAVGTVAGAAIMTGGAAMLGAKAAIAGMGAIRAGTAMGSAAQTAYQIGQAGGGGIKAGLGGVASAASNATGARVRSAASRVGQGFQADVARGRNAAWHAMNMDALMPGARPQAAGAATSSSTGAGGDAAPSWAQKLRSEQAARHHRHVAAQTIKDGDRPGGAANPDLSDKE